MDRCVAARRVLRRTRARGAAMVEAVIVISVLIILFASLVYMWRVYQQKVLAMSATRAALWTYAQQSNCGTAGDPSKGYSAAGAPAPPGVHGGGGGSAEGPSAGGLPSASDVLGTSSLTVQGKATAPAAIGGATVQVQGSLSLMCNEPPYNGNLAGFAKAAYHDVTNW